MKKEKNENTIEPDVFVGKEYFDGASIFKNGLPIFTNRATRQRPPDLKVHVHDFIEIAYVMFGEGRHQIGSETSRVSKGDLFVINPGVPHRFISDLQYGDEDFMICNVDFSVDLIGEANLCICKQIKLDDVFLYSTFFEKNNTVPYYHLRVTGADMKRIEQIYEDIYAEFMRHDAGYENVMFSYLMILLVTIFRKLTSYDNHDNGMRYKKNIINEVIRYINENFDSPDLTLENMAARAFLSKNYFGKLFREYTNQKFSSYVQNKRISAACELLTTSERKVTDIISSVGYHDVKYFNAIFKQTTGKTPSEYRRSQKEIQFSSQ